MKRPTDAEGRVVEAMTALGFTTSEARVYAELVRRNPATGYELAARTGVPRSAIYAVVRQLEERGLASRVEEKPARYQPIDPENLAAQLETGFRRNLADLRAALAGLTVRGAVTRTWTLTGYAALIERARGLVAGCTRSVHLSIWRREAEILAPVLRDATGAGREVVLFSFTPLPDGVGRVFSYDIPEPEVERHWPHKLVLIADRCRVLVGGATDSDENQAILSEEPAIVEMAVSNLVLDLTLFGQRFGMDTADVVAGLALHMAPVDAWMRDRRSAI